MWFAYATKNKMNMQTAYCHNVPFILYTLNAQNKFKYTKQQTFSQRRGLHNSRNKK
jgi:hypothetical protein